ncbi:MAG TPA: FG-GAP-like repeat-containing protein [Planctomycetota bacterium]|nr:FG-GAP-like repeat-containing protein [Planctomycetota bacterium]
MRLSPSSCTFGALVCSAAFALLAPLPAQWVTFQNQTSTRLVAAASLGSADPQEKDYAWGDFDQDGDIDLVVVRKQPFTSSGRYPNVLFMNENGVLTDRTATLASASSVPGSQGFLDDTNDRDVVAVDVNGDGWLDLVTATTLTAGLPQYIRVPRVYINLGDDLIGNWLGFLYDDPLRINDMQVGASWNGEHRFCSVAAGDIDHDGDMDIYFGDYQQGGSRSIDVDDRLLLNDGLGYFTDVSSQRMSYTMLESSFAMKVAMVDMNLDGFVDILKDDALNAPQAISISYNNGVANPGFFTNYQLAYNNLSPYHFHVGDLNNDNLPDMIVSDDGQDRYQLHQGVVGGMATFGPAQAFTYTGGGGDDGFGGNNIIADLNNDGWKDAIIADVDVDISGCSRRCHIFRNLGNAPNVSMQEEQISGAVCGIPISFLTGTFDVAVFDINGDGWNDMVIGRCTGTEVWMNQPPIGVSFTFPGGLPTMISPGAIRYLDVVATGIGGVVPQPGTGKLFASINGGAFVQYAMTDVAPGQYRVLLPNLPNCADELRFYVSVESATATTYLDPPTAPTGAYEAVAAVGTVTLFEDTFEGAPTGWTVVNDVSLTGGAWEVAVPIGTTVLGVFAAPNEDGEASTSATHCYVTQNGLPGGAAGAADVDGGPTDLISPPLDYSGSDGIISYKRWFYRSNATGNDTLTVAVSPDNVNWVTVETVAGPNANQWINHSFRVSDFIVPSATVRVRFRTSDNPANTTTEAAIDAFRAEKFTCTLCQPSIGLQGPGTATFSLCGGDLSSGTFATFSILGTPPFASGILVSDFFLLPAPWSGGTLINGGPALMFGFSTDGAGNMVIPGFPGGFGNFAMYAQAIYLDAATPFGIGFTNGLRIQFRP